MRTITIIMLIIILSTIMCCIPSLSSPTILPMLTIKLVLCDGEPLPNATVKVAPSIYYIDDKNNTEHVVINITDKDGIAVLYNVEVSDFTNKVYVAIYYSIYGKIHADSYTFDPQTRYIEITLPYKKLSLNYKVTDEYLNPLNGSFKLIYTDSNEKVYEGIILDGEITLNSILYRGRYLLIDNGQASKHISYQLLVNVKGQSYTYTITWNSLAHDIVIDLYNPVVNLSVSKKVYTRVNIAWITVLINVSDGVYSNKINLIVLARWIKANKTIYRNDFPLPAQIYEFKAVYNTTFHVLLDKNYENDLIDLIVYAVDPSGKTTCKETLIDPWPETAETLITSSKPVDNTSINESMLPTPYSSSGINGENQTNRGSYFNPPKTSQVLGFDKSIYFIGIIVSLVILIIEIKTRPSTREHS